MMPMYLLLLSFLTFSNVLQATISGTKTISYLCVFTSSSFLSITILSSFSYNKDKEIYMIDLVNKNIDDVYELLDEYELDIDISYEYNDNIDKDMVISQSIDKDTIINDGDKIRIVVSLVNPKRLSNETKVVLSAGVSEKEKHKQFFDDLGL